MRCTLSVAVLSSLALASIASGAVTFTSRGGFNAALAGADPATVGGETWDSLPLGLIINDGDTVNGLTYRYSTGVAGLSLAVTDAFGTSEPHVLGTYYAPGDYFSGVTSSDSLTIEFSTSLTAFGVWVNTADLAPGAVTITTSEGEVAVSGSDPFPAGNPYGQFVGITTEAAFDSVTFSVRPGFTAAFDGMAWAAIPAPGSGALSLLAVATATGGRRRR